jgi:transcriptional regulator with XRE-family HTH domain
MAAKKLRFKDLGLRLKQALEKRAWSYADLAKYCKVQDTMIYRYVKDKNNPSIKHIIQICAGLDINTEWLKYGNGSIEQNFNINDYSTSESKRIVLEKSTFGDYELLIRLKESEVKEMVFAALN